MEQTQCPNDHVEPNPDLLHFGSVRDGNFLYAPNYGGSWRSLDPHQSNDDWIVANDAADHSSLVRENIDQKPNLGYDDDVVTLASYGNQGLDLTSSFVQQERLKRIYGQGLLLPESSSMANDHTNTQALSLSLSSNPPRDLRETQFAGNSCNYRNAAGPLGPFTGYAIILNSSRFLKPAQELLSQFCNVNMDSSRLVLIEQSENHASISASASLSVEMPKRDTKAVSCDPHKVDFQQNKVKLQYLQEEVCGMYKQYHQQMRMVVSSFESVAGLSAATPYISLALKKVSKNFLSMKNAISDHVKLLIDASGEEVPSPTTCTSSGKSDVNFSRVTHMEQIKAGFCRPYVWRPQRGLPERAVAVLRAWLFEHFLHPYPTDNDKLILATKTGLSRNQVSNWFINARVRLWKPMVEEIHMLETKGFAENYRNHGKKDGSSAEITSEANGNTEQQYKNKVSTSSILDRRQLECWGGGIEHDPQSQEKRARLECQISTVTDGSLMGFMPSQRNGGIGIGGLGAVSLTLGLRHGNDGAQQQQQLQQPEDELRRLVC